MNYLGTREHGPPPQDQEEITAAAWQGIVGVIEAGLRTALFAQDFPDRAGGGNGGGGGGQLTDKQGNPCPQKILNRVNAQFGTNFNATNSDLVDLGALGFGGFGGVAVTDNIGVTFPAGSLAPGQVQSGRFGGGALGTGSTLHVVNFVSGFDSTTGVLTETIQPHLDQGNPFASPLGALSHLGYVLTHSAGPCP